MSEWKEWVRAQLRYWGFTRVDLVKVAEAYSRVNGNKDGEYEASMAFRVEGGEVVSLQDVKLVDLDVRYTLTESGYRAVMQQGAKLNGEVKAGEDKDASGN